jgi:hypothetical protein
LAPRARAQRDARPRFHPVDMTRLDEIFDATSAPTTGPTCSTPANSPRQGGAVSRSAYGARESGGRS